MAIPHVFVMDANGKVRGSFVGFKPPKEFIAAVKPLLKRR